MIQNERQYRVTKTSLERFEAALERVEAAKGLHPVQRKAQLGAISSELETLRADLAAFEALRSSVEPQIDLEAVLALPENLIRARIAAGLTHKDLATRLGLKEQQIQRYEATGYKTASLERVMRVAEAITGRSAGRKAVARAKTVKAGAKRPLRSSAHRS